MSKRWHPSLAETRDQLRQTIERRSIPIPITGCWIWDGPVSRNGYGKLAVLRRAKGAHQASYAAYKGSIARGLCVLHECDEKLCVNPDHLRLGTHADNVTDKIKKGRARYSSGESHFRAKLSASAVAEIRSSEDEIQTLAGKFSVDQSTVRQVKSRKTWRHV
jgi:hypothetical protein